MSTFLLIAVVLVSVIAIIATALAVARDGYRPLRTDRSRLPVRNEPGAADHRTAADRDADDEAAVRAATAESRRGAFADVAAEIAAATARPFSSVVPPEPGIGETRPAAAAQPVTAEARPLPALPQSGRTPSETEPAHTAVRRGARARGPRRAASAPKSPR
jgi:hypothetical protein